MNVFPEYDDRILHPNAVPSAPGIVPVAVITVCEHGCQVLNTVSVVKVFDLLQRLILCRKAHLHEGRTVFERVVRQLVQRRL